MLKVLEQKKSEARDTVDEVIEVFQMFDKDGNGFMSIKELRHILGTMAEKLSEEELAEMEKTIDDGSGMINYEDFAKVLLA